MMACATLKEMVHDPEKVDAEALQHAIEESERAEVNVWNAELVENARQKIGLIESFSALKSTLDSAGEESFAEPEARVEFEKNLTNVKDLLKQLRTANVPLPPEISDRETLAKAEELLK